MSTDKLGFTTDFSSINELKKTNPEQYISMLKEIAQNHAPFLGNVTSCVENALDEITSKSLDEYISSINEDAEPSEIIDETELLNEVEFLNNGLDFLNGNENCIRPTAEQMKWGLDDGWSWKQVLKGYDVFDNSDDLDSKSGSHKKTLTISRIDIMDTFMFDKQAALQAEKDGIKLIPLDQYKIDPKDNANHYRFIDIPENHLFLQEKNDDLIKHDEIIKKQILEENIKLGDLLYLSQLKSGLNVRKLCSEIGVSSTDYYNYINHKQLPSDVVCKKFSSFFNTDPLFWRELKFNNVYKVPKTTFDEIAKNTKTNLNFNKDFLLQANSGVQLKNNLLLESERLNIGLRQLSRELDLTDANFVPGSLLYNKTVEPKTLMHISKYTDIDYEIICELEHKNQISIFNDNTKNIELNNSNFTLYLDADDFSILKERKRSFENNTQSIINDENTQTIIEEGRPNNVGTGYKVFWLKDGKLYPPMVQNPNGKDTPVGEWLTAEVGKEAEPTKTGRPQVETGGEFAHANKGHVSLKPGFHISDLPEATQFNKTNPLTGKKELFPMELVWAEVEFSKDKNYQEEAHKNGINSNGNYVHALAGMNTVPQDGYYRYRTNPDPNTPEWNISGKMKVVRVLSRYEVDKILKENGKEPPLHEEDYLQKVNQKLDRLINKSATVKVNGEEHHCDGLLKGYAESIDENNKLQKKIIGLEESYKTLSNLYQSKNKKEITVEVDREEI